MSQFIKNLKPIWEERVSPVVDTFYKVNITPNALTITGLIFIFIGSYFIILREFIIAGIFILIGNLFDALDGILARKYNLTSKFGAFLDSVIDRYSDAIPLFAILIIFTQNEFYYYATILSLLGSFMTSYVKARAEGLGIECNVGLFERPERSIVLILGLLFTLPSISVIIIAVASNITVIQRVIHVYKNSQQ
ncbi:MAG: archaetidylinositol phosphate synthase [Hydrogenothermaceae bacterium]|nr:archaetidylinositol phosphate synthase [Hydrogenothermaceae bacterium]